LEANADEKDIYGTNNLDEVSKTIKKLGLITIWQTNSFLKGLAFESLQSELKIFGKRIYLILPKASNYLDYLLDKQDMALELETEKDASNFNPTIELIALGDEVAIRATGGQSRKLTIKETLSSLA
jgi:hypothetical protein